LNRRYGISLVGEGGEYETLVLDAPFFKKRIEIIEAEKIWKNQSGYFLITKAKLENK
jgi:diphthamide synthase (EF-2-diphthine--ammonia ligase)